MSSGNSSNNSSNSSNSSSGPTTTSTRTRTTTQPKHHRTVIDNDDAALDEAVRIQQSTLAAVRRIQSTTTATAETGIQTLERLQEQREQFTRVFSAADRVDTGLQKTEQLQNRLGWMSLRFNTKRSAKQEVDSQRHAARKLAQQHAKLAQQRLKEKRQDGDWSISGDDDDDDDNTTASNASSKKSTSQQKKISNNNNSNNKKKKWTKKIASSADAFANQKKDLLSGVDLSAVTNDEHRAKLHELNEVDQEIDAALDIVSTQVDTILTMGKEMRREVQAQDGNIHVLSDRVERSKYKQDVVNKRTTRFLDGKVRKQHALVDTFGSRPDRISPLSIAAAARKTAAVTLDV